MLASRWATPPAADSAKPDAAQPQHQQQSAPPHEKPADKAEDLSSQRNEAGAPELYALEQSIAQPAPSTSTSTTTNAAAASDASLLTNNPASTPTAAVLGAPIPAVYGLDPMADEFAQTREDDDLFDDDFTPVAEPVVEVDLTLVPVDDETAVTSSPSDAAAEIAAVLSGGASPSHNHHSSGPVDAVARPPPTGPSAGARGARDGGFRGARSRGNRGARGGARGGAPTSGIGGLAGSRFAPSVSTNGTQNRDKEAAHGDGNAEAEGEYQAVVDGQEGENKDAAGKQARKEGAVRGDRSATGGIKKDRLTEEQLAARISAIKLKNESLTAAHARAEADLAQYQAREKEAAAKAAQRAKADRQNRQVMMGERERNRMRKLNAQSGREWDLNKEEGFGGTERGARGARRGAHGGVVGSRGVVNEAEAELADVSNDRSHASQNGHGKDGRGSRRGGGRRTFGGGQQPAQAAPAPQAVPMTTDFPELPSSSTPSGAASKTDITAPQLSFPNAKQATGTNSTVAADLPAGQKETDTTQEEGKIGARAAAEPSQAKSEAAKEEKRPDPPARLESFGISSLKGTSWADQVDGEE